jgi:hypothetical protein
MKKPKIGYRFNRETIVIKKSGIKMKVIESGEIRMQDARGNVTIAREKSKNLVQI